MLRPATTTQDERAASSWYACSTAAVQSAQVLEPRSSSVVPWPGSRGSSTFSPPPANASARPRTVAGLPVKPCRTSAPAAPSSGAVCDHGSAPESTG